MPIKLSVLQYKKLVDDRLTAYLSEAKTAWRTLPWTKEACTRLIPFVTSGKTIRGSLVLYSYKLFSHDLPDVVVYAAAAIELFHAGLLIHDDIMDRDLIRRGMPTMQSQFDQLAASRHGRETAHFGLSQAINVADFCYFAGFDLLSRAPNAVTTLVAREIAAVTLAQMQDVASGHVNDIYDKDDILALYRTKTARYTFSLPLMVGAMLANVNNRTLTLLASMGETVGLLFQIRDDELNSMGSAEITGKSVGSDVINHKQTLQSVVSDAELTKLKRQLKINAQTAIRALPISDTHMIELLALLRFCEERNK